MGVNDLLNDKLPSSTDNLMLSLVHIVNKCKLFGVTDLVSGIAFNKRLPYTVIKKINKKIVDMSKKNGRVFIDNGTYTYWNEVNAYNFIFILNNFVNMHTPLFNRHKVPLDCSDKTNLQILQDLRQQH